MITLEQAKEYCRIDFDDEDAYIQSIVDASLIYIDSMVGEGYKLDEKAIKMADLLQLKLISDMYEQRSTEVQNNMKIDRITNSILDKLANYGEEVS